MVVADTHVNVHEAVARGGARDQGAEGSRHTADIEIEQAVFDVERFFDALKLQPVAGALEFIVHGAQGLIVVSRGC